MTSRVNTVNAEQFRGTKFFTLTPHSYGNRVKVTDPEALRLYAEQLTREIKAAEAQGETVEAPPTVTAVPKPGKKGRKSKASVTATKALLVSPPLEALKAYMTAVKTELCGQFGPAQQSKLLEGVYVVKDELIETVDARIEEANARLSDSWIDDNGDVQPGYVPAFLEDIPQAIARARDWPLLQGGLGPLFNPADYAGIEERLKDRFSLECLYIHLGIPEDLPEALKAKASEKFEAKCKEAAEEVTTALYTSLGAFLDRLNERLQPQEEGAKPKVFRDSLVENVRQFCECFDSRNFIKDAKLEELVNACRKILQDPNLTPENLRKYSGVRENTRAQFEKISAALTSALEERKGRAFDFTE
jgi:hypothetical protein